MHHALRRSKALSNPGIRLHPNPAPQYRPAAPPLILPSLAKVPKQVIPSASSANLADIEAWATVLQILDPSEIRWPAGRQISMIAGDVFKGIEIGLKNLLHDLSFQSASSNAQVDKTGRLNINVWAYGNEPFPLFWHELQEAVAVIAPRYSTLFQEALVLLGRKHMHWADIKEMLLENLDSMLEPEDIPEAKKRYEACGLEENPFVRFRGNPDAFRKACFRLEESLGDLTPTTRLQQLVHDAIQNIYGASRHDQNPDFHPQEYDGSHVDIGRLMAILYSRADDLSEQHWQDLDCEYQSGDAIFGEQLSIVVDPTMPKQGLISHFRAYLDYVKSFQIYERIAIACDSIETEGNNYERNSLSSGKSATDLPGE